MKLISIEFRGLKTFEKGTFSIDFFAADRVPADDESVSAIQKPLYTNNIIALAGINASGKTSSLRLIRMALSILNGRSIDRPFLKKTFDLFSSDAEFAAIFWSDDDIWILESKMVESNSITEDFDESPYVFDKERLYRYTESYISKKGLSDKKSMLKESGLFSERCASDRFDNDQFISPTISIVATLKKTITPVAMLDADFSSMFKMDRIEEGSALHLLDSNIEYLSRWDDDEEYYEIKMKCDASPQVVALRDLERILSSGTIRGLGIIDGIRFVLGRGGYMILDEVENHLNKQLVKVIIGIFASKETNPHGATLVFTTHYPEILDSVHRKDNTYFLVRDDDGKTAVIKYSSGVKRIENKKSEVFLSNWIKGTAPKYSDIESFLSWIKGSAGE